MESISKDLTTALVDNELHDEALKNQLISKIETDDDLRYDYIVQSLVKNLIKEKVQFYKTPDKIRQKILKRIKPKELRPESRTSFFAGLFSRPAFSFTTAIIIVIALVLIIMNRPGIVEPKDFAIDQLGNDNMFVQARTNFQNILEGRLIIQLTSSNPEEIKNFFTSSGVKYSTLVPEISEWDLLGAIVTEDSGEKFAHNVYTNDEGEIVYLFQVEESYLQTNEIIKLTSDLLSFLDQGNCYTTVSDNYTTLMAKTDNNIYAVVSNASLEDISQNFCRIN